ncbi:EAL domain-containing protein [Vibrio owensii]|uniref:EAL domain-containing protein n=1 Tax=Vibrio owensii TaxID=696485 RepID=UPI00140509E8|nr:EAL domain-containing protein [Vibrio owensii]
MKIMIIEDDSIQSTSLKLQIMQLGYRDIVVVDNGVSAQKQLDSDVFDLIFCDIRMPHLDGITLLSQHIDKARVKGVVIMSVLDDNILNVTRGVCHLIGYEFVDVLNKPFCRQDIESIFEDFKKSDGIKVTNKPRSRLANDDIIQAFDEDRFFVLYQPQFDFRTGALAGVEALVRIEHPVLGTCTPDMFLTQIEELGLSKELFVRVLEKATKAMSALGCSIKLSVNISQSLLELDLCDLTLKICNKNAFHPTQLTLELTEEQAYHSSQAAMVNLARLRLYGIGLSIDDFGKGFASLDKLVDIPFTELKIDKAFISQIMGSYKLQQITKLALNLAQSLGLNCVAEGVEDEETWEYLKELGADVCQGYYTGKPVQMKELTKYTDICSSIIDDDIENYDSLVVVVIDKHRDRSSALSKLLSKDLLGAHIVNAKNTLEAHNLIRDMPVNSLISDATHYLELKRSGAYPTQPGFEGVTFIIQDDELINEEDVSEHVTLVRSVDNVVDVANIICTKFKREKGQQGLLNGQYESLSKRELDVAQLLVAGFTNKYISYELGINQKTVSTYKARILQKLDAKSTVDLVRIFSSDE